MAINANALNIAINGSILADPDAWLVIAGSTLALPTHHDMSL